LLLMYMFWSEEANHTKRGSKRGKKLVCTRYINTIPELKQGDVLSQNESERLDLCFQTTPQQHVSLHKQRSF